MECNKQYHSLTHPQKRIWYIEKIYSGYPLNTIGGCLKINGSIDFDILSKAINEVIKQNDGLRIRLVEREKEPYQFVSDPKEEEIDCYDFSKESHGEENQKKWANKVFKEAFIFENSPLYYFAMYKVSDSAYGIMLKIHHMIADGWSVYYLIQKQICEMYDALSSGQEITQNPILSYIDYIDKEKEYIESDKFIKHKEYWMDKLKDIPETSLYKSKKSPEGKRRSFNMTAGRSIALKKHLKTTKYSLNEFFIAVLMIYLNKTTSDEDITISLPVLNRPGAAYKRITGMFISTMPFRLKLNSNRTISEYFSDLRLELKRNYRYQKYPYNLMMSDTKVSARGFDSLFKVSLNCYNIKRSESIADYKTELEEYYCGYQSYSLQIVIKEWLDDASISLNFDYKIEDYPDDEIIGMFNFFGVVMDQLISESDKKIKDISLSTPEERDYLVHTKNSNKRQYPVDKTIHELFEEQVMRTPKKTALIHGEKHQTYATLNKKANVIAHFLRRKGIKIGSVIGLVGDRSFELLAGILGVLKAGGAYLPIDANYPVARINYMLEDSKAALLLTTIEVDDRIDFSGEIISFRDIVMPLNNDGNPAQLCGGNDLAYIIYTSGSTGKPKGVMINHSSLINYVWWGKTEYIKGDEIFAFYTSIAFDLTVTSIFIPLLSGNTIAIYCDDGTEFILDKILRQNISTVVKLTPSHLSLIKERDNSKSSIRRFVVGGEDLKVNLSKEIYRSFDGTIELFNEYGPTEATVGCMIYKYKHEIDNGVSVPIGTAISNSQIYLLDNNFNVVPEGIDGEIYISGDGLSRGYLNNPLANKRFVENPFIKGQKMYQTGDIAKYMDDGNIVYQGRKDKQVKIRGHRIELGEIEECLIDHPKIKDAVVAIKEKNTNDKLLCAYLIKNEAITDEELNQWLLDQVPKYMMPSIFISVDIFPLTVNGKVDVQSLLAVEIENKEIFVAGRNEIERALVAVMKDILMLDTIGMKDNFYRLGGDSIKAIQITSKLNKLGYNTTLKDILTKDTIEEIASGIEVITEGLEIYQGVSEGLVEKTPIVEWFFSKTFENEHHYNQSILLTLNKKITREQINSAMEILVKQHDGLRLNYDSDKEVLFYNKEHLSLSHYVDCYDVSEFSAEDQIAEIETIGYKTKSGFDMSKDLLVKACVIKRSEEEKLLLITAHHLLVDGVSWRIILQDLSELLDQIMNEEAISLSCKTHSYGDWSKQLLDYSKDLGSDEIEVWNTIEKIDSNFPTDYDLGEDCIKHSDTVVTMMNATLVKEFSETINDIYNMTLNEGLIISLVLAVNEFSTQENVVIELEGHGREVIGKQLDISRTVGWFTSIYPVAFQVDSAELGRNIKYLKDQLRAIPNNGVDYGVLKYLNRSIESHKKNSIRFNYLGDFDNSFETPYFELSPLDSGLDISGNNTLTSLLDINVMLINQELKIMITYSENKFRNETIKGFMVLYMNQIKAIVEHCGKKEEVEFTLSDFDTVDLSQADLDSLFTG